MQIQYEDDMPPAYEAIPEYATPYRSPLPPSQQQQLPSTSIAAYATYATYATPVWRSTPHAAPISVPPTVVTVPPELPQRHIRDSQHNQMTSARNKSQLSSHHPSHTHNTSSRKETFKYLDGDASFAAMEHMDMRGAATLPPDSNSDHSGGSNETVKIDDMQYADA
ncbi:uncharacterized protein LOC111591910 isoform X2 [Drosophila hydei]|uniref:Uncharacterized protein LOC111591910 isoform X2 n=1 Tax=Drosophila hydei TaxID=7224 RepID=A0A6J1L496_DROHY|nr:uncharacterized protein LOC111591910 isoform X2 [Drosophila hydei]